MGEQGAKSLRGGSMADVIFAGTATRPALGRAEVSLTIDNSDGALPIAYTEVTISRTLFRAGGSEYAINGSPVRLLDIQELLSDTGMGREMHVIVGQGRLDEVLQADPDERRSFIEEAAGVLKHRRRKEKALRKLDSMTADLNRLNDLTAELRRQLGPLARQAEAARKAQVIQATVRDAKARILADDLAQAQARMAAHAATEAEVDERRNAVVVRERTVRERLTQLDEASAAAHPMLADLTEQWQRLSNQAERFRSLMSLAGERYRSLSAPLGTSAPRETPDQIRVRVAQAREEELQLSEDMRQAREALTAAITAREASEETERTLDRNSATLARALADKREDRARLTGRIAAAHSRIEQLNSEAERVTAARDEAAERLAVSRSSVAAAEEEIVAHDGGQDDISADHERLSSELAAAKQALEDARAEQADARGRRDVSATRAQTLEQSLAPDDAADDLLAANLSGIGGWLREDLNPRRGWEAAVETALSGLANALLADSLDSAVTALRHVRETDLGRIDIAVRGGEGATEGYADLDRAAREALKSTPADDAILAVDAVTAKEASGVVGLLAGIVLAVDLSTAQRLVEAGAPVVVTRDGDTLRSVSVAGGAQSAVSVLARQAAAREAAAEADAAEKDLASAAETVDAAREALTVAEAAFEASSAALSSRDSHLAAATAQLGVLRQNVSAAAAELARNRERLERINGDIAKHEDDRKALDEQLAANDTDPAVLEKELADVTAQRTAHHEETVRARAGETESRLALRVIEERARVVEGKAESLERHARAEEARLVEEERRTVRRKAHAALALEIQELAEETLQKVEATRENVANRRREAEESRLERDSALSAARRELDEVTSELRELDDAAYRRELAMAEQRIRLDQLVALTTEELGIKPDDLIDEFGPLNDVPTDEGPVPYDRAQQEERLGKAQRQLSRLGAINPLALEEHAALEERHQYLADQLEDLRKSKADLLGIVRDIDERVESVLTQAYVDISKAFEGVFATLFPGGEGHMVLTEPESPLTTGIEIEARPAGKRVKRLSLLSGGERSLTALAFLVAIFKARPSPFYVLDEVEAALDDTNLGRLIEIFKELRESSQLIVITHQKRTMEVADTLYGVSMAERGVTKVISQRLAEVVPTS